MPQRSSQGQWSSQGQLVGGNRGVGNLPKSPGQTGRAVHGADARGRQLESGEPGPREGRCPSGQVAKFLAGLSSLMSELVVFTGILRVWRPGEALRRECAPGLGSIVLRAHSLGLTSPVTERGGSEQQKIVLGMFWSPEVSDQGRVLLEAVKERPFHACLLASGCWWQT